MNSPPPPTAPSHVSSANAEAGDVESYRETQRERGPFPTKENAPNLLHSHLFTLPAIPHPHLHLARNGVSSGEAHDVEYYKETQRERTPFPTRENS